MKAHELSKYLTSLARILKRGPDFDMEDIRHTPYLYPHLFSSTRAPQLRKDDLPVALSALVALSSIDKKEWAQLIRELALPIQIRPRDASRDLLGKLLRILETDPIAREILTKRVRSKQTRASPELVKALSTLLK